MTRPRAPSPFDAHMNAARQRVFAQRPQPSGDIGKVWGEADLASRGQGMSMPERTDFIADRTAEHLEKLHDHSKVVTGGDGPYPIAGYQMDDARVAEPTDATISRTKMHDFLANWYGKHWPEVQERMLKAEGAPEWHMLRPDYNTRNLEYALNRPVFEIGGLTGPRPINAAYYNAGLVQINPSQAEVAWAGFTPSYTRHHEFSHMLFPPKKAAQESLGYLHGTGFDPEGRVGTHIKYSARPDELMANLAHMARLEYGLTGKPLRSLADRIRAVQKWVSQPIGSSPNPSGPGWHNSFGPDPILQHGPEAGNPAHGYKFMQKALQEIVPRMIKPDRKAVIDALEGFGSTGPKEDVVYG